ncbi:MAG: ArsC family (seleno)protein [Candidatus Obscuribacterales bacterium]|nr:ArsC family (seleno)protein [Candidatus Obscuribacterales bacterium]
MTLDWIYHRKNCNTCQKAQDFLEAKKIQPGELVDARKVRLSEADALKLAGSADQLYATKGTKLVHFDLHKDKPADETLLSLMIGPSGNLRAPTLRVGKTLLVGFNEEAYEKVLG